MNNFKGGDSRKRGGDFGGRSKFGGGGGGRGERRSGGGFGGGNRGSRPQGQSELFSATCSACNKQCEVPFRPNGEKPVFCSACFNMKSRDEERGSAPRAFTNRDDSRRKSPSFEKPYHEHRPSYEPAPQVAKNTDLIDIKRQLATIESRLNRILDVINPPTPPTKAPKVAPAVAVETVAEVLPKKERKPKTVKAKTPAKKKVAKKAAKKVVKKKAK